MAQRARKVADREHSKLKSPKVQAIYPKTENIASNAHLALQILYEFTRGANFAPTSVLEYCETKVTDFMADYTAATDHIKLGSIFSDNDVIREGYFRVTDSFVHLTPMARGCWESAWRLGDSLENISKTTTLSE